MNFLKTFNKKIVELIKDENLRDKIISLGGEFLYNTCLTNINVSDNKIRSIEINNRKY